MHVTPQTNLGEIVAKYPKIASYLQAEWGLHCVACFANAFDSLEDGMALHGYKREQIDEAVSKINEMI